MFKSGDFQALQKKSEGFFKLISFEEVLEAGKKVLPWKEVKPDTIFCFSYTSGTTGDPKGAMFSHRNICMIQEAIKHKIHFEESDVHISYLPMPHIFEKVLFNVCIQYGYKLGVYSGNVLKLLEDIQILKPTFFASVPRLLNKIYASLNTKIDALKFPLK